MTPAFLLPGRGFVTIGRVIDMPTTDVPFDPNCNRTPVQCGEYEEYAKESYEYWLSKATPNNKSWDELDDGEKEVEINRYVRNEEGTYNPNNGHFACTECYINMGMPSAPFPGWKMP